MFCDELNLKLVAGKGGDGCVSFRREKFVPRGGPNGGDGGHGGDIIFKVNPHLNTLSKLANQKVYKGEDGVHGQGKNMHGKNAEAVILEVPPGTIIYNKDKSELIADLNQDGAECNVSRGGKGGLGNARFTSSTHQAPKFAETGEPGEEVDITLELKLVAELGLIGLPSAGKSTLISVISNAKPKIAAYHFTTLIPNLGVVAMKTFGGSKEDGFLVADIPGLIEGASEGKGLGHQFLRHIARTRVLVHVIDGSLDNADINYKTIRQELKKFDPELDEKPEIVAINKNDLLIPEIVEERMEEIKKVAPKAKVFVISSIAKEGLKELMFEAHKLLQEIRKKELKAKPVAESVVIHRPHLDTVQFQIEKIIQKKERKVFRITGKRIEQLIVMTDLNNIEGLERVYHYMERMGIKRAIERHGATFGDFIRIRKQDIPYRK
jgi:GTPase